MPHLRSDDSISEERLAARRILTVTEEELQRIILDIHDGPVQKLFAASAQIGVLQKRLAGNEAISGPDLNRRLARLSGLLEGAQEEIRSFLGTFRSPAFLEREMTEIIRGLVMQFESFTECQVDVEVGDEKLPASLPAKIALFRTCQEALFNAYRHSGADRQQVRLRREEDTIVLEVSDAGRGFEPPPLIGPQATERHEHIGLRGMRDRVSLVGGTFELESVVGRGTRIVVRIPCDV